MAIEESAFWTRNLYFMYFKDFRATYKMKSMSSVVHDLEKVLNVLSGITVTIYMTLLKHLRFFWAACLV